MGDWKWKFLEQLIYTHVMLTLDSEERMMNDCIVFVCEQ